MVAGAFRVRLLAVVFALLGFVAWLPAAENFSSVMDQALRSFRQGKLAEAAALLRKAQTLKPGDAEVVAWLDKVYETSLRRDETNRKRLIEAALEAEQLGTPAALELARLARQILGMTHRAEVRYIQDPNQAESAVDRVIEARDQLDTWLKLVAAAKMKFGRYLVPAYVKKLADPEPSVQLAAFRALVDLGRDAVIPLIVALDSDNAQVREQIANILGRIGHPLVVSSLFFLAQHDPDQGVRQMATKALQKLRPVQEGEAWQLLVNDALRFLRGTATLPRRNYKPYAWKWQNGELVGEHVLGFQVGRRNADVLLLRSTKAAGKGGTLLPWAVFAANRAAEVRQWRDNLALLKNRGGEEALVALLEGQAKYIEHLIQSVRRLGLDRLSAGLTFALQEMESAGGSPAGVLQLIEELRALGLAAAEHGRTVASLKQCLNAKDVIVRFEAASTLAQIAAPLGPQEAGALVKILAVAIAEPGARVGLVISPDDDVRAKFVALLDEGGFLPIAAENVWQGLAEAANFPPKHLVFIDSNLIELSVPETIRYLRNLPGFEKTPIVVIAPSNNEERDRNLYHKPEEQVLVVADTIRLPELRKEVLAPVVQQAKGTRAEGEVRAARAAEALKGFLLRRVSYDLSPAADAVLAAAVDPNRPESVRIPCCFCAGELADKDALKGLLGVATGQDPLAVRVAAIDAIGELLRRFELTLSDAEGIAGGIGKALQSCLQDKEKTVRVSAARALGKAKWEPDLYLSFEGEGRSGGASR